MKAVTITAWCDACGERGRRVEAPYNVRLSFLDESSREIDLCEKHHGQLIAPVLHLYLEHGQDVVPDAPKGKGKRRNSNAPTPTPCPSCDRVLGSAQALGTHRVRAHGYRKGDDARA